MRYKNSIALQGRKRFGQSMVEFAFTVPFLMLVFVAILFFGRYFFVAQVLLHAVQEGALVASGTPNLNDPNVQEMVLGFSNGGAASNYSASSTVYGALAAGGLLSNAGVSSTSNTNASGTSGNLPSGSQIQIVLPGQTDVTGYAPPTGTVEVMVQYPFQLIGNPFNGPTQNVGIAMTANGSGTPVQFKNFTITQRAIAAQEIYQNIN